MSQYQIGKSLYAFTLVMVFHQFWKVEGKGGKPRRVVLRPVGVRILPLLPLKVDWIDFLRIRSVKSFLKREGDKLFPGWSQWEEKVTFVLQGDEGQTVWINQCMPSAGR